MPGVIGPIDCTHVSLQLVTGENGETFQRYTDYVDYLASSHATQSVPPLEGVTQRWGGKTNYFEAKCVNISSLQESLANAR